MTYTNDSAHQAGIALKQIVASCGLNVREAAQYLGVQEDSVRTAVRGKWRAPPGWFEELGALFDLIEAAADELSERLDALPDGATAELGYAADDTEAQSLGWPCVGAQMAAFRRVWEDQRDRLIISLVPRGSTPATAAAVDARER